ncbi:low molecular weight protein-tyrosine-phosphatase [Akkermansia glycaniphila]|uniref:protein-tyrosine-phosphatase n=1 Tax=Akkermansia glycaniphila TaxID=1679444 RepID=A0A1C7PAB6_9BACT|nr:low molecular weight protein-tyrosine-phosphatase [Akkermansia glycaniphila]OCA02501.1 hypothetical protein AC781_09840 [Akkermansia glycaniphila]SEH89902.1 low molecular weight phosphotyrosine protein phosphatase [Akkermansia glycaniphila]
MTTEPAPPATAPYRVLFVCLGNICRSPAAEIVFDSLIRKAGLEHKIQADSAATSDYHIGDKPDRRMLAALQHEGYAWGGHLGRQLTRRDFETFDLIVPMDNANLRDILALAGSGEHHARIMPMCSYLRNHPDREIPDPYYGGPEGFTHVIRLLEDGCNNLLITTKHALENEHRK